MIASYHIAVKTGDPLSSKAGHAGYRPTCSSPKVDGLAAKLCVLEHIGHCRDVPLGKVHDVDVVADRSSVGGGVVAAPNTQELTLAEGNLQGGPEVGEAGRPVSV